MFVTKAKYSTPGTVFLDRLSIHTYLRSFSLSHSPLIMILSAKFGSHRYSSLPSQIGSLAGSPMYGIWCFLDLLRSLEVSFELLEHLNE